jgi:hypothetical protein
VKIQPLQARQFSSLDARFRVVECTELSFVASDMDASSWSQKKDRFQTRLSNGEIWPPEKKDIGGCEF